MKKGLLLVVVMLATIAVKAQDIYVGGSLNVWRNSTGNTTSFKVAPEIGYNFNEIQSPNQKIPDRKTKCVIKTHINIKQNVIFGAKLKPV